MVCINCDKSGAITVPYTNEDGEDRVWPLTEEYIKYHSNENYEVHFKLVPTPGHTEDVTIDYVFAAE